MQLSFKEAKKLSEAFTSVYAAYSALEDVRASGGFSEYVDEKRECKHCGAPTSEHVELAAKTANSAVRKLLLDLQGYFNAERGADRYYRDYDLKERVNAVIAQTDNIVDLQTTTNPGSPKLPPFEEMWKRVQEYPEWSAHLSSINRTMDCECFYDLICRKLREGARTEGEIIKK